MEEGNAIFTSLLQRPKPLPSDKRDSYGLEILSFSIAKILPSKKTS